MKKVQSQEKPETIVQEIVEKEVQKEEPPQEEESEFICYGDIITLSTICTIKKNEKNEQEEELELVIYDDGFNISDPDCIPQYAQGSLSYDQVMNLCLFKIENQMPYIELPEYREESQEAANQNEFNRVKGESLTYGEKIILRHCESSGFLTFRQEEIAKQHGCARVSVKQKISEGSILEI